VNKKCVVTIDIIGSTVFADQQRAQIQRSIFNVIDQLKAKFVNDLFTVGMTAGDEFQLVINSPEKAIDILKFLKDNLPARFRSGVGFGHIEAVARELLPSEMYGSAFYLSRNAINIAKKKQADVIFSTGDENLDLKVNTIMELILFIQRKWTKRQQEVLKFIDTHEQIMQKDVAAHFGISEQAISKITKSSGFESVRKAEQLVKSMLAASKE